MLHPRRSKGNSLVSMVQVSIIIFSFGWFHKLKLAYFSNSKIYFNPVILVIQSNETSDACCCVISDNIAVYFFLLVVNMTFNLYWHFSHITRLLKQTKIIETWKICQSILKSINFYPPKIVFLTTKTFSTVLIIWMKLLKFRLMQKSPRYNVSIIIL